MQNQNDTDKLKVLPPVLKASEFSQSQRTEGYAIWWGAIQPPFLKNTAVVIRLEENASLRDCGRGI